MNAAFEIYWFNCCIHIRESVWPKHRIFATFESKHLFRNLDISIPNRTLWTLYSSYEMYHDTIMVTLYFYQSSAATAYGQITFLCQKLYCLVQYCFDVLDSIFGAKKEIQIMCDQLRFVQHFHEMRHFYFLCGGQ